MPFLSRRSTAAAILALTAGLVLAGCSGSGVGSGTPKASPSASDSTNDQHDQADVEFVQQMIPHHQGALAMAKIVPDHTSNPKVTDLADRISKAQDPEIRQMQSWLEDWSAAPTSSMSTMHGMDGMDHGSMGGASPTMSMDGMSDGQDTTMFDGLEGQAFDTLWLRMMIRHHEGAVAMARTELDQGASPDAKALARRIVDGQQAEIDEMKGILGQG